MNGPIGVVPGENTCPSVEMAGLDTLWLYVAGTICNLRCTHCFISCSPDNHSHGMMTLREVRTHLEEAARLGVREYYLTGGEPFMNRELLPILEATLRQGPVTVLTNGLFLDIKTCGILRTIADGSDYSLDLRVSLDGWGPEDHDAIRGPGTFVRCIEGIRNLADQRFIPVITVTEVAASVGGSEGRSRFLKRLGSLGLPRPRLKILPLWRIGAEATRLRGYEPWERLSRDAVTDEGLAALQCSTGRTVTTRGVYVCPILIDEPGGRMGETLGKTLRPFGLSYGACHTCYVSGVTCRT
ncbi:MAG TPA: radical SAM protein [Candidatus Polarisedimenticolia bacterium]|nr:radical SAM protein [Candidatus Polarisedimenticolia bacterium]